MRLLLPFILLPIVWTIQVPFQRPAASGNVLITPKIDDYITSLLAQWNSSGLAVAVVRQDISGRPGTWDIEFGSYGTAQADGSPVTPDTLFAIASNSKLFLSVSVGLLINNASLAHQRGQKLGWDTKIKTVLPEWGLMDQDMQNGVTIQDMLSHRTGLPRHDFSGQAREGGVSEMISTLRFLQPSAEHREQYQYNNLMYETLSHLPATLLNQSYESYIAEHVFSPLGMSSSTYSVAEAEERGALAHGFQWSMEDRLFGFNGTKTALFQKIWAGAGGVLTSARDLSIWVATLLNKGRHPMTNQTVIPEDIIEHAALGVSVSKKKAQYPELSPQVYGCGQHRFSYRGHEIVEHGGSNPGFKTQVSRLPNDNLAVVVLSNDENGNRIMEPVKYRIIDEILGLEPIDWAHGMCFSVDAVEKSIRENQNVTPRPLPAVLPSVSFAQMEGTFHHGAYGSIQPCFRILGASSDTIPTYIVPFKGFFSSYLRLAHFSGNTFNASVIWSNNDARQAEGYGEDGDVIVGFDDRYVVEFVAGDSPAEDGFAFTGNMWGKEGDVRPLEGEGKDSAEVWFGRVYRDSTVTV
ncbi:beta-lactamase/transpeptidase-like protein [Mycena sp. CBHHK59/15]|nr:beta-lactamase/transpeptidase-like protein [Mycena sp. CBHHK59/15]